MLNSDNKWVLLSQTPEEKKYMQPLFFHTLSLFEDIFGASIMHSEICILYNDGKEDCPMLIENVSPIMIRTNAIDLSYWAQFIFHLSHEMTHYVIRQYKTDKTAIVKWFEETICEAMSLYILRTSGMRWMECNLHSVNPTYGQALEWYWKNEYEKTDDSVLKKCSTNHELELVESTCEMNRKGHSIERNYLFDTFCAMPNSIAEFVYYPLYVHDNIQIDFEEWERKQGSNSLLPHLKSIHPKLTA